MMTEKEYLKAKNDLAQYDEWAKQFEKPNGWRVIPAGEVPPVEVSNDSRAAVEVYEFMRDKPSKYFLYIHESSRRASTWTGETLGSVEFGYEWVDNFGGRRVPIRVKGINGVAYHGTYYKSSGNYARIKAYK